MPRFAFVALASALTVLTVGWPALAQPAAPSKGPTPAPRKVILDSAPAPMDDPAAAKLPTPAPLKKELLPAPAATSAPVAVPATKAPMAVPRPAAADSQGDCCQGDDRKRRTLATGLPGQVAEERRYRDVPVYVIQAGPNGSGVELKVNHERDEYEDDDRSRDEVVYRSQNGVVVAYDATTGVEINNNPLYHRDHLIPYRYCKHNGVGLYRPWTFNAKWDYWYGEDYQAYTPGQPDRFSPMLTPYGIYPSGHGYNYGPSFAAGAMGNLLNYGANCLADMNGLGQSQPYPQAYQHAWGTLRPSPSVPWSLPSRYPTYAIGHGIHPGLDAVSYSPRHAGSYSPFIGFYGFGGRFSYGYGPYNYSWSGPYWTNYSGAYSGFGQNGSFRNGIWTSGLQF